MGVLILQLLACGQLILFSLALENATYQVPESPLNKTNTSQPYVTPVSLNTTGNYTENNASTLPNNSTLNSSNTNVTTSTTTMTPTSTQNITVPPEQSNATTVYRSTTRPNVTSAQTNQSRTSAPITTRNISSTVVTTRKSTTYSSTKGTTVTTSKTSPTTKPTEKTSTTVTLGNSTILPGASLSGSETSLTILFSIVLGMIILMILVYFAHKFRRRKQARVQYTHRRLQNEDTGEQFIAPDDTLVISGGLYDGPQIYNPTMTVQSEEDYQTDTSGFAYRPSQFRLEFLNEDQRRVPDHDTFHSFHAIDQEP
nr:sialomucin core protein 24-like [Misgurnus anguillicaudatus]